MAFGICISRVPGVLTQFALIIAERIYGCAPSSASVFPFRLIREPITIPSDNRDLSCGARFPEIVLGRGVDRRGFFAPAFAAFGFTLGLLLVAAALFFFRLGAGLGFETRFRLPDLRQPFLTPLQFVGQFVATTASQRSILLGVNLLGLLEQLLDLSFQPLDLLVHVPVTHRLVPRG